MYVLTLLLVILLSFTHFFFPKETASFLAKEKFDKNSGSVVLSLFERNFSNLQVIFCFYIFMFFFLTHFCFLKTVDVLISETFSSTARFFFFLGFLCYFPFYLIFSLIIGVINIEEQLYPHFKEVKNTITDITGFQNSFSGLFGFFD